MVEGAIWDHGIYFCDLALQSNKDCPESWYLMAFCSFYSEKYEQCSEAIETLKKQDIIGDKELVLAGEELKIELDKVYTPNKNPQNARQNSCDIEADESEDWLDEDEDTGSEAEDEDNS